MERGQPELEQLRRRVAELHEQLQRRTSEPALANLNILESIADAVAVLDHDWRYVYVNGRAEAMAHIPREKLLGGIFWDIFPDLKDTAISEHFHRVMCERASAQFETYYAPLNLWAEVKAYPAGSGMVMFARDITERKRTEERLRAAEDNLRRQFTELEQIYRTAPVGLSFVDTGLRYTRVNEQLSIMNGVPADQLLGRSVREAIPEIADVVVPNYLRVMETGRPLRDVELELATKAFNRERRSYRVSYYPVADRGKVLGVGAVVEDITDRKRAEKTLREREEQSRTLLAAIPDVITRFNRDLRMTYISPAGERFSGIPNEQFYGMTNAEAGVPEALARQFDDLISHVFETGEPVALDLDYPTRMLGIRRLSGIGVPEHGPGGRVESVLTIVRDVTERKRAEDERDLLLAREKEARETAEELNRVAPLLAAELDLHKLMQTITDAATRLAGAEYGAFFHRGPGAGESYTLYTVSGAPREGFAKFPTPRIQQSFGQSFGDGFTGKDVVRSDDLLQDHQYRRQPENYWIPQAQVSVRSYLSVPVVSRSGETIGRLVFGHAAPEKFTPRHQAIVVGIAAQAAIAMDNARLFAETQRAHGELKRSNEDLRRANRDLETFAYSASHDLQEPLRNVALYGQLLEKHAAELNPECRRFLDGILEGTGRMENLVRDLLAYSRATRHAEGPVPEVDASMVLKAALENLKTSIDQNSAVVTADPLPKARIHEVHLSQVFQNLIGNALKYRGANAPRVHISGGREDGRCRFSVADNGIGIDPKYRDQIFGLFKRLHQRGEYSGSGVGLAICHRIVEQYGGRIWVEPNPGGGSVFFFTVADCGYE